MAIELSTVPPTAEEFGELRAACGWGSPPLMQWR